MPELINEYSDFYKNWRSKWKTCDDLKKKELKEELRRKLQEYKNKRRKINQELFQKLYDSLVHLYPDEKIGRLPLMYKIYEKNI